jgi:hypothetical protein
LRNIVNKMIIREINIVFLILTGDACLAS